MSSPEQNYFFRFAMRYPVLGLRNMQEKLEKNFVSKKRTNYDVFHQFPEL